MYPLPAINTLPIGIVTLPVYNVDEHLILNATDQSAPFDPTSLTGEEHKHIKGDPRQRYQFLAYVPSDMVSHSITLRGTVEWVLNGRNVRV